MVTEPLGARRCRLLANRQVNQPANWFQQPTIRVVRPVECRPTLSWPRVPDIGSPRCTLSAWRGCLTPPDGLASVRSPLTRRSRVRTVTVDAMCAIGQASSSFADWLPRPTRRPRGAGDGRHARRACSASADDQPGAVPLCKVGVVLPLRNTPEVDQVKDLGLLRYR